MTCSSKTPVTLLFTAFAFMLLLPAAEEGAGCSGEDSGTCYDDCLAAGGDEAGCRERCAGDDAQACYGECIAGGGDDAGCRLRCSR